LYFGKRVVGVFVRFRARLYKITSTIAKTRELEEPGAIILLERYGLGMALRWLALT
jgi:hypothetical protein